MTAGTWAQSSPFTDCADFDDRIRATCDTWLDVWSDTPPEMPELGPRLGLWRQFSNARATRRLIDEVVSEVEALPDGEPARHAWRERLRERFQRFGQERLGWPDGYRRLLFADAFYESSTAFARHARAFDPSLSLDQLGQALRNVWIGNSLQMLLGHPVTLRPGLFAYSLLYPVTDNWLDDPTQPVSRKRAFNERFARRLAGLPTEPADEREAAADRLVQQIEHDLPRRDFPGVYESLLGIQQAQSSSLDQHDATDLADDRLARVTFDKGGSSVLTDVYLVTGTASPAEERFAFGYGVFLQLLDDLQDVTSDLAARHETLFTREARRGPLDTLTARLARFVDLVLASHDGFSVPHLADHRDLIRRNCLALLAGSVAEQPGRFSRRFRRRLAARWPVSFRATRRLRRRAVRQWARLQARSTGASALFSECP